MRLFIVLAALALMVQSCHAVDVLTSRNNLERTGVNARGSGARARACQRPDVRQAVDAIR